MITGCYLVLKRTQFFILRLIIYNMESKIFLSWNFFYPMFANCVHAQNDVGQKCSRLGEVRFGAVTEIAHIAGNAKTADRYCRDWRG